MVSFQVSDAPAERQDNDLHSDLRVREASEVMGGADEGGDLADRIGDVRTSDALPWVRNTAVEMRRG